MPSFTPQLAIPDRARLDPSKHVNFNYGMVLGVDDFNQEFTYLSERDRWLIRDLIGYGTVAGLQVRYEPSDEGTDRGPRVSVSPGVAASPSGQLICVTPAQCAYLVEWLQLKRDEVAARLAGSPPSPPSGSPPTASPPGPLPSGALDLYVVVCYADCPTDNAPVPGEPCRSEDELLLPSRLRDDFLLELRFDPPDQREEEAVRRFVAWLRQVPVVDGGGSDLDDLLDALRAASAVGVASSPPSSSPPPCPPVEAFMAAAPPAALAIPRDQAATFLRAALRLWTTELLPCWRAAVAGCGHDCGTAGTPAADADCVTLAHLVVDVLADAAENRLLVGPGGVLVDEERRPCLVDLRVLQEWVIRGAGAESGWLMSPPASPPTGPSASPPTSPGAGPHVSPAVGPHASPVPPTPSGLGPMVLADEAAGAGPAAGGRPAPGPGSVTVAGGRFDEAGNVPGPPHFSYGGLRAVQRGDSPDIYDLEFDDYDPANPAAYVVSGCALTTEGARTHVLEVLARDHALAVRVRQVGTGSRQDSGFMLQVTRFDGGGP